MKVLRILLLLFMTSVVLLMAGCPGLYDSQRRFTAQRHYGDAPSEETRREIEEAKRLDRRDIWVFEFVMLGVLGFSVYAYIRAGKSVHKNDVA
jgi:hypothetical protein